MQETMSLVSLVYLVKSCNVGSSGFGWITDGIITITLGKFSIEYIYIAIDDTR